MKSRRTHTESQARSARMSSGELPLASPAELNTHDTFAVGSQTTQPATRKARKRRLRLARLLLRLEH